MEPRLAHKHSSMRMGPLPHGSWGQAHSLEEKVRGICSLMSAAPAAWQPGCHRRPPSTSRSNLAVCGGLAITWAAALVAYWNATCAQAAQTPPSAGVCPRPPVLRVRRRQLVLVLGGVGPAVAAGALDRVAAAAVRSHAAGAAACRRGRQGRHSVLARPVRRSTAPIPPLHGCREARRLQTKGVAARLARSGPRSMPIALQTFTAMSMLNCEPPSVQCAPERTVDGRPSPSGVVTAGWRW